MVAEEQRGKEKKRDEKRKREGEGGEKESGSKRGKGSRGMKKRRKVDRSCPWLSRCSCEELKKRTHTTFARTGAAASELYNKLRRGEGGFRREEREK